MKYAASTVIVAPPEDVWKVLTHGSTWTEWEPNVTKLEGTIEDGGSVTVHTKLSDQAFPVKVTLDAPRRMTWTGGMPLGLFRGVRTFSLTEVEEATRVDVEENFSGPLLFLMRRMMPDLQPSFDDFVVALKERVEGR